MESVEQKLHMTHEMKECPQHGPYMAFRIRNRDDTYTPWGRCPKCQTGEPAQQIKPQPVIDQQKVEQIQAAKHLVPDELIHRITASGTPEEAKAKVQEYIDHGCTVPILYGVGGNTELLIDTFGK